MIWRSCGVRDVQALLEPGNVSYVAWGGPELWRTVLGLEVLKDEDKWTTPVTVKPGGTAIPLEAYYADYRNEVRLKTPHLIDNVAQIVDACTTNKSLLQSNPTELIALLIKDEDGDTHLRGVLRDDLPEELRMAIEQKRTDGRTSGSVFLDDREMAIARTLMRAHNVLLVGPPGTGKTRMMTRIRHAFRTGVADLAFDPDATEKPLAVVEDSDAVFLGLPSGRESEFVTFHPSLTYDDFMVGIRPSVSEHGALLFEVTSGAFIQLAARVRGTVPGGGESEAAGLMLIDEFNRGNVPEIFGEVITLLESDKRLAPDGERLDSTVSVRLAVAPDDVGLDESFELPHHLYVLASMNSVDRSVAPIDSALRRRFRVIDVPPDLEVARRVLLDGKSEVRGIEDTEDPTAEECRHLAVAALSEVNTHLASDWGWEFELGHSYILEVEDLDSLLSAWNEAIRPHLNAVYRDGAELMADWLGERQCEQLADKRRVDVGIAGEGAVTLRALSPSASDLNLLHRLAFGSDATDRPDEDQAHAPDAEPDGGQTPAEATDAVDATDGERGDE